MAQQRIYCSGRQAPPTAPQKVLIQQERLLYNS